jgi:hypothetical protein
MFTRSAAAKSRKESEPDCAEEPEKKERKEKKNKDDEETPWTFTPTLICFYLVFGLICYLAYPRLTGAYATLLFYTGAAGFWALVTLALFVLMDK